jgi:hypothetical protein
LGTWQQVVLAEFDNRPRKRKDDPMKIDNKQAQAFKIKNRKGYAIVCCGHLTEGKTPEQAYDRMCKALSRTSRKK